MSSDKWNVWHVLKLDDLPKTTAMTVTRMQFSRGAGDLLTAEGKAPGNRTKCSEWSQERTGCTAQFASHLESSLARHYEAADVEQPIKIQNITGKGRLKSEFYKVQKRHNPTALLRLSPAFSRQG